MADFVTLSCPSCGGKLEITNDVERFACSHCGREHIVKRSGGIVSLSPVVDALNKVGVGVDKTAAELAIVRLQKEIPEIYWQKAALLNTYPRPVVNSISVLLIVSGILIDFIFLFIILSGNSLDDVLYFIFGLGFIFGLLLIFFGALPIFSLRRNQKNWDETTGVQLKSLDKQIAEKNAELKHHQGVVSL